MKWKLVTLASIALASSSLVVSAWTPQSTGHREQIVKFTEEVWTKGNVDYIDKVMDPEFVRYGTATETTTVGIPDFKAKVREIRNSFTDYNVTLIDQMGVGDKATFTWRLRGNYIGADHKLSPGRSVDLMGKSVWIFKGDKVVRELVEVNQAEYHRQIEMALPYSEVANRALALSYFYEVVSRGNVSSLEEIVSDKHILHDPEKGQIIGIDALRETVLDMRTAFPDLNVAIYDVIANGNNVSARWTLTGTHRGEWNGIAPTGKRVEATGLSFMRIKDDKIQESWNIWDRLSMRLILTK
jgi:steroid delta-isomerase-like uncharacterized protein